MRIGTAYLVLKTKATDMVAGLNKAKTNVNGSVGYMQKRLDSINFKVAGAAALAFGGIVAVGIKKAIDAASDLEETTSKFNVVFQGMRNEANKWANELDCIPIGTNKS